MTKSNNIIKQEKWVKQSYQQNNKQRGSQYSKRQIAISYNKRKKRPKLPNCQKDILNIFCRFISTVLRRKIRNKKYLLVKYADQTKLCLNFQASCEQTKRDNWEFLFIKILSIYQVIWHFLVSVTRYFLKRALWTKVVTPDVVTSFKCPLKFIHGLMNTI